MTALGNSDPRFSSHLMNVSLFADLTDQQRASLLKVGSVAVFEPGALLFREGDPVQCFFILRTGRVKVRRFSPSGHEVVLHLAAPPHMVGCRALTEPGTRYPADGVAVDNVVALRFCRESFLAVAAEAPHLMLSMLANMNRRLNEVFSLQAATMEPVEQRIAGFILRQALPSDADPSQWNRHRLREVRLTKSLVAAIVGTSTETAIRVLSKWKKRRLIASDRGRIQILDPGAVYALGMGKKPGREPGWTSQKQKPLPAHADLISRAV